MRIFNVNLKLTSSRLSLSQDVKIKRTKLQTYEQKNPKSVPQIKSHPSVVVNLGYCMLGIVLQGFDISQAD